MAESEQRGLRLLALDGGGVRGLSELLILEQLMSAVHEETPESGTIVKKPCELFDIICGTSTGGLVAILLGCLKLSVQEAIIEYEQLAKEVFGTLKSKRPGRESKYSVTNFEKVIRRLTKKYGGSEEAVLLQPKGDVRCKVFVCTQQALAIDARHPYLMRSYEGSPMIDGLTIWQAARATSAAPTFFKRLKIGNHEYIDGGIGSNNPSKALLKETQRIFRQDPGRTVSCIVNLGTGVPKDIGFKELSGAGIGWLREVVGTLKSMATDCEETAEEMAALFKSTQNFYFRFNVEQGMQGVEMDKYEDLNVVRAKTVKYMAKDVQQDRLLLAAQTLASDTPGLCRISELSPIAGLQSTEAGRCISASETEDPCQTPELSRCPPLTSNFCGREAVLDELHQSLDHVPRRAILWGFPGAGKTAIALRYKQLFDHKFKVMVWVNASSQATMLSSFAEAMLSVTASNTIPRSVSESKDFVRRWLEKNSEEWLMVIDSVDDLEEINVRDLLPQCSHGTILITSSRFSLGKVLNFKAIEVKELEDDAGVTMLLAHMGGTSASYNVRKEILAIVRQLHGLPLAIEQAGTFLRKGYPLQDFRKPLTEKRDWVFGKRPKTSEWTYDRNRCIHTILDMLNSQLADEDEYAPSILTWISLLGPGEIFMNALIPFEPEEKMKLTRTSWIGPIRTLCNPPQLCTQLVDIVDNPWRFWATVAALEESCMIKTRRGSQNQILSVELHNTVRQWAVGRASRQDQIFGVFFAACALSSNFGDVGEKVPTPSLFVHRNLNLPARNIFSVLRKCVEPRLYSEGTGQFSLIYRILAGRFANHFFHMHQYQEAQEMLQRVIEHEISLQQERWPTNEASLFLLEALGDCHRDFGQFETALDIYTDLLRHATVVLGDTEAFTLRTARKLREIRARINIDNSSRKHALVSSLSGKPATTSGAGITSANRGAASAAHDATRMHHHAQLTTPRPKGMFPHKSCNLVAHEHELKRTVEEMRTEFGPADPRFLTELRALGCWYYESSGNYQQAAVHLAEYWTTVSASMGFKMPAVCHEDGSTNQLRPTSNPSEMGLRTLPECYEQTAQATANLPKLHEALHHSVCLKDVELCSLLLRTSEFPVQLLQDLLLQEASGGNGDMVCRRSHSTIDALMQKGFHPVNIKIIELLLNKGGGLDESLLYAASSGNVRLATLLLDGGADPNHVRSRRIPQIGEDRSDSVTPLFLAATKGHLELTKLLISRRADVRHACYLPEYVSGFTPFMGAVFVAELEVAKFLFHSNPNPVSTGREWPCI